ncbi:MAG: cation diffusion facilitator family transporter [Promethearchaeota archaeon]
MSNNHKKTSAELQEISKGLKIGEHLIIRFLFVYLAIVILELSIGLFLGSEILTADGLHNLLDLVSLFTVYIAVRISSKSPNQRFPYGFMKIDSMIALFLSLIFMIASYFLIIDGINKLIHPEFSTAGLVPVIFSSIATIITLYTGHEMLKKGKELNVSSLIAIGQNKFFDSFMGIGITVSLVFVLVQIPYIEGIVILVLSTLIIFSSLIVAKDGFLGLMDAGMSQDDLKKIEELLSSDDRIKEFKDLRFRKTGPYYFGEVSIILPPSITTERAVYIIKEIKNKLLSSNKRIALVNVLIDVHESNIKKLIMPIDDEEDELDSPLSDHFARAPHYLFVTVDVKSKKVLGHHVEQNEYLKKKVRAGLSIVKTLTREKADVVITNNIGEIAYFALQQKLIEIYKPLDTGDSRPSVIQVIQDFLEGRLRNHDAPTREKE